RIAEEAQTEIYDRYFTEKQLRDLVRFFKSDTGEHYVEVARKMAAETRKNLEEATRRGLTQSAEGARQQRTRDDLQTLGLALAAYFKDHTSYPKASNIAALASILMPKYAPTIPQQDGWGHPMRYEVSADGQHYRALSAGPDGVFGT